jgi:transposase
MRSKELSVELQDMIVLRHRSGKGYKNISAALKIPKNTVASIIRKWKKFGTTKTPPRSGRPAKLSNQGTKNLMVTATEFQSSSGDGRTFQKDNHLCTTPPIRPL